MVFTSLTWLPRLMLQQNTFARLNGAMWSFHHLLAEKHIQRWDLFTVEFLIKLLAKSSAANSGSKLLSWFSSFQEAYIADLDAKSGASLKLTLINPCGRIWTMVAGGGASVVYRCLFAWFTSILFTDFIRVFTVSSFSAATPSATWVEWMNWQTTANTPVHPVNSRPTTMRKPYSLWWRERGILKVSNVLRFPKCDFMVIQQ